MYKKRQVDSNQLAFFALRLTWPFPPHSPAGDFALVRITTFLSRFSRQGLHLRRAMLTLYIFDKAYVGPFARVWLGLAATDSQSFFILLYLHCFCQTKNLKNSYYFSFLTLQYQKLFFQLFYCTFNLVECQPDIFH